MLFADTLRRPQIGIDLHASSRADALRELVGLAAHAPEVVDQARLLDAVAARERRMSTGVGEGLALPHAWTPAASGLVLCVATFAAPVDWHALDGAPVDLAVLLAGPDTDPRARVRHLAHVSRVLSLGSTRERLARATGSDEVAEVLTEAERVL